MIRNQPNCTDINESGLIHFDEALAQILSTVSEISGVEQLPIELARSRISGQDIISPINVPAHTNSAVDGYALHSVNLPDSGQTGKFDVAGTAFAGKPFTGPVATEPCIRIMTGAPMPEGLDTVIMQEHTERLEQSILIDDSHRKGQNVRQAGEDFQQGQTILKTGKWLTPPDIGLIASLGTAEIDVRRKLRIAIASTGDEIYNIGSLPSPGGIYDSNRYTLSTALDRPDIEVINLGILEDTPNALLNKFNEASSYADMIISTGGVSVGDADHTRTALQTSGSINFWKVAIKPGRPLAFGQIADSIFFGLPGNPVAVMVTFYLFVIPAIEKMLGIKDRPLAPTLLARTTESIRKKPGRTEVPRGILEQAENGEWTVKTTGKQGSGILSSMSVANAFILLPHDSPSVHEGDWVTVLPFSGLF